MTTAKPNAEARLLTQAEFATIIRAFREMRQWSQETLAALSGLSVRTIQRVERGDHLDSDTHRALARAFDIEDLDVFNKPHAIPTPEGMKKAHEDFERTHLVLETKVAATGRELAHLFESATMDMSNPGIELDSHPAAEFAALLDYLRDYRDCADSYTEVQKLDVHADLQRHLDALDAAGISICYAKRNTQLVGREWQDKTPWPVTLVYVFAFHKGKVPDKMAVPKKISLG